MNGSTDASCQTVGAFFFRAHALIAAVASSLDLRGLPVGLLHRPPSSRRPRRVGADARPGRAVEPERAGGASVAGRARRLRAPRREVAEHKLQLQMFSNLWERNLDHFFVLARLA